MKIDEKSYKSIIIYYIRYKTTNRFKPFYLVKKINGCIEEINKNKYLVLGTHESKDTKEVCRTMKQNQRCY